MNRIRFASSKVYDFLLSFDDPTVAKILGSLEILDEFGEKLRPPKSKKIAKGIYELRILGGLSVRIFYAFCGRNIWILHAFVKKSQKIPPKELKVAIYRFEHLP